MTKFKLHPTPVFFDFEASGLDGYPIEVGWAMADEGLQHVISGGSLIRPAAKWTTARSWSKRAQGIHGISLDEVKNAERNCYQVAKDLNERLSGRELFSDSNFDEGWLDKLYDAAGLDPSFVVRRTIADVLIANTAEQLGVSPRQLHTLQLQTEAMAPRTHRAEADARYWAQFWLLIVQAGKIISAALLG